MEILIKYNLNIFLKILNKPLLIFSQILAKSFQEKDFQIIFNKLTSLKNLKSKSLVLLTS